MKKPNPELTDAENPEWTAEVFARARPTAEVLGADFVAKRAPGRPKSASPKARVTLRVDGEVLAFYKAMGAGWQTRINRVLADDVRRARKP